MIASTNDRRLARGALAAVALFGVVFPGLAAGFHVHHGHVADDCDLCLQLSHLVFALADGGPATVRTSVADIIPDTDQSRIVITPLAGDPARAPPVLS